LHSHTPWSGYWQQTPVKPIESSNVPEHAPTSVTVVSPGSGTPAAQEHRCSSTVRAQAVARHSHSVVATGQPASAQQIAGRPKSATAHEGIGSGRGTPLASQVHPSGRASQLINVPSLVPEVSSVVEVTGEVVTSTVVDRDVTVADVEVVDVDVAEVVGSVESEGSVIVAVAVSSTQIISSHMSPGLQAPPTHTPVAVPGAGPPPHAIVSASPIHVDPRPPQFICRPR
jgi:hypothetical protein